MIHTAQPPHGTFWLARLSCAAAWAEHVLLAERLAAFEASAQQVFRTGIKNTPSPRNSGERVGVRGNETIDIRWECWASSAPPHPTPAEGGAGSKRIVLGCDPGAGCSAATARVLMCAYTVASPRNGAPAPRSGAPLPQNRGRGNFEMGSHPKCSRCKKLVRQLRTSFSSNQFHISATTSVR